MHIDTLIRYKDILAYRTLAQLKSESRNNYLGYIWFILDPLIGTVILYFVFGILNGNRTSEYVLFLLTGMMVWQWIEGSIMMGVGSITAKIGILNVVPMPKYLFPIVSIMANTWKFLCVFLVLILLAHILGFYASVAYLTLPLVFFVGLLFIVGLGIPLSLIVTYMPDFINLISSLFRLLFFLSGIFFTIDTVPQTLLPYFNANPIALLMHAFRNILIDGAMPSFADLFYCACVGTILLIAGIFLCHRIDKKILKSVNA